MIRVFPIGFATCIVGVLLSIVYGSIFHDTKISVFYFLNAEIFFNVFFLIFFSVILSLAVGLMLSWVFSYYTFRWKRLAFIFLMLPLSIPPYVMAFILKATFPIDSNIYLFFHSYTIQGVRIGHLLLGVLSYSLVLYPYVFIMNYSGFSKSLSSFWEFSSTITPNFFRKFFKIILPSTSFWIFGSCIIIILEVVSDFGVAYVLNIDTFSTSIYEAWSLFFSFGTACQISCLLLLFVGMVFYLKNENKKKKNFYKHLSQPVQCMFKGRTLKGYKMLVIYGILFFFLFSSVLLPIFQLITWVDYSTTQIFSVILDSIKLATLSAFVICILGLLLSYADRIRPCPILTRIACWGYGVPGTIIAIAILMFVTSIHPILLQSVWILIFSYSIRFFLLSYENISISFDFIPIQFDELGKTFRKSKFTMLRDIYFPLLSPGIMVGFYLVFVDVLKEVPITLMMRPLTWNTLSVKIFEYTSEAQWSQAALPSILMVLFGILSSFLFVRLDKGFSRVC